MDRLDGAPAPATPPESSIDRAARAVPYAHACLRFVLGQARGTRSDEPAPLFCEIVEFRKEPDGNIAFSVTVGMEKIPDTDHAAADLEPSP